MLIEKNRIWAPIVPRPQPLWSSATKMVEAYFAAERPLRPLRSQRYSLVVTRPLPAAAWSKP